MIRERAQQSLIQIWIVSAVIVLALFFASPAAAQVNSADTFGIQAVGQQTVLGQTDIRITIARVINVALSLLGVLAVGIVIWGGWKYMTSKGNEDQIGEARKILANGAIGLAIILSAWAITYFIIRQLSSATGSGTVPLPNQCQSLRAANDPTY